MLGVFIGEWVYLARRAQHGFESLFRILLTGFPPLFTFPSGFLFEGFGVEPGNQ